MPFFPQPSSPVPIVFVDATPNTFSPSNLPHFFDESVGNRADPPIRIDATPAVMFVVRGEKLTSGDNDIVEAYHVRATAPGTGEQTGDIPESCTRVTYE